MLRFETEQTGRLRLGVHVEDVDISVPLTTVEIGPGQEITLVSPVTIACDKLEIDAEKLIVECSSSAISTVYLGANLTDGSRVVSVPVIRGGAELAVSWPGAEAHPWNSFASPPTKVEDPRVDEALRRLRKFVVAFRSHSKGSLARIRDKLEHSRMTKGSGQAVFDQLLKEGIVSLRGQLYHLDPDRLAAQAGTSYADCNARRFGEEAIAFVQRALDATG